MRHRVLFIAYLFPPIANSGTQRPLKFAKYLPSFGWKPVVLTAANTGEHQRDPGLLAELPPDVAVVRVPMLNEQIGSLAAGLGFGTAAGKRIGSGLSWRLRKHFQCPDLYALWRPTARRAALRIFEQSGFDAIYATGFPWTSLLVGHDVARMTGRPLVADFRDPWASEDVFRNGHLPYDVEIALERQVVHRANRVLTVSPTLTRRMRDAHPEVEGSRFVTIHNGFDPTDLIAPAPERHAAFRIVYTGVWKPGYGPGALYDVIEWIRRSAPALLTNVEVVAAGFEPGEAARRGLASIVREVGVLPHRDAVSLMHSADVLYLPNADGVRQQLAQPGKMFEYLATGRPVLALTDPDGDAGRIIRQVGGGVVVSPEDPGNLLNVVATTLRERLLRTPPQDRRALATFERSAQTERLAAVLDQALHHQVQPSHQPLEHYEARAASR